jgi:hypothetical protein
MPGTSGKEVLEVAASSVDNARVKPPTKTADSLILSVLTALVCGAALLLGYSGFSPSWGKLIMWLACPALVFFSAGYVISDLLKLQTRKQAAFAAVLLIPAAAVVWHFRFKGI